ncbi:MAG TPA: hypothetical protein ENI23_10900 [bacterium]|nr:hypothetical protein [bacterium]
MLRERNDMDRKWLLLDCNLLCHRAKHSMGDLSHKGSATGVVFGFLKTVQALQEFFDTPHVVFCWDSKTSKRKEIFPEYKSHRRDKYKEMSKEELEFEKKFQSQMKKLRRDYLPTIGYRNVFVKKGYESDDIIASICNHLPKGDEAIIVSSDHDLYQLISSTVSFYDVRTQKILTPQGFKKVYGIESTKWGSVKVLAGCTTDSVPGIKGVGEKTAIRSLQGELKPESKAYQAINSPLGISIIVRNRFLIVLPLPGIGHFELIRDKISKQGWERVMNLLGMKSLRDKMPIVGRRKKKNS